MDINTLKAQTEAVCMQNFGCTLADEPLQFIIQRIRTGLHSIECRCIADALQAGAQHRIGLDVLQVFADGRTAFFLDCLYQLFGNTGRSPAVRSDARKF